MLPWSQYGATIEEWADHEQRCKEGTAVVQLVEITYRLAFAMMNNSWPVLHNEAQLHKSLELRFPEQI